MTRRPLRVTRPDAARPGPEAEARDLADRLARLRPDWGDAERYFEARAELVAELRGLARRMEGGHGRS